eukprot:CAMPEP_0201900610 /NCGR_PEP_ID=MMETSP0902-20130614/52702_1 /ASSEMBLY_ACC=CAM_ASM_000551 /TAXON_ID=420261 /ORGANISM="Thalassiosira antarctica, Strain CCMP982" /LENGTH=110 /DNA_ID=CAMNT_0048434337 /DNA_START=152 /DNA_END=481 /DNA_ORIENTATION=+
MFDISKPAGSKLTSIGRLLVDMAFIILRYNIWGSDCHMKGDTVETLVLHDISNALGPSRVDFLPDSGRAVVTIISPARENGAQSFGQNNVRVFSPAAPVELIIAYCTRDW